MSYFCKVETIKQQILKEVYNKKSREILIEGIFDSIDNKYNIFYENNNEIYVGTNINNYLIKYHKLKLGNKPWLPCFDFEEITFEERFIIEDGKKVIYENSNFKKNINEKYKNYIKKEKTLEERKKDKLLKIKQESKRQEKRENYISSKKELFSSYLTEGKKFLCFDIEKYENNQSKILEIGYVFYDSSKDVYKNKNMIIKENIDLINGKHVPNHKYDFNYGETIVIEEKLAFEIINKLMDEADILVGHDIKNDFKVVPNKKDIPVFDTQKTINPSDFGFKGQLSLFRIAEGLHLYPEFLHNAGNDAYFTFQSALRIAA